MKKSLLGLGTALFLGIGSLSYYFYSDNQDPFIKECDQDVPPGLIPNFREVPFNFSHHFDENKSLPLMGSCLIDVDDDGTDEVFIGGGINQKDVIFKYRNGYFEDISDAVNLPEHFETATLGAVSFDLDEDGFNDLLVARDNGVWFFKNEKGKFKSTLLDIPLSERSTPVSFTLGDVNKDNFTDIFLCSYTAIDQEKGQTVFNDPNNGASSLLLINNGNTTFRDATVDFGLEYMHNTFQSVLVDLDDDNWLDLVVAYETGEARTYKNNSGSSFEQMPNPLTDKFAYPMGIAVGDYNNDNKPDLFFSNTGTSIPPTAARGDLRNDQELITDWLLFQNEGEFSFSEKAAAVKLSDFEFSWGCVFEDFNLDGRQDLVVAENSLNYPPHKAFKLPSRFLLQREDGTFSAVEEQAGVVNENYAITPLVSDFNDDGYPDLIYSNLDGPVRAFINDGGNHNFLKVRFAETSAHSGVKATLHIDEDSTLSDVYVVGEGLSSDQTNTITFGLGKASKVETLILDFPSGISDTILNPEINQTLTPAAPVLSEFTSEDEQVKELILD